MRFHIVIICTVLLWMTGCMALSSARASDTPPVPQRKTDLETLESKIAQEKQQQQNLQGTLSAREGAIKDTKKKLVTLGRDIRHSESALLKLEERIAQNRREQEHLQAALADDYGTLSELVLALGRMQRLPAEALIARPGAPLETAQSAMLLQTTLPAIESRAAQARQTLNQLYDLQNRLTEDQAEEKNRQQTLAAKQKELDALLAQRKQSYQAANINYARTNARIDRLSREARDLKDLLARLEAEQAAEAARRAAEEKSRTASLRQSSTAKTRWSLPKAGKAGLPVSGHVKITYGQPDDIGAESKGLHIDTRDKALVTAPMGGIVRFAGQFKNYGQMVVIEHEGGYHSLIGGLGQINVETDERLNSGEPVGRMPSSASHDEPVTLYYELRHKGQPIDPAKKFGQS